MPSVGQNSIFPSDNLEVIFLAISTLLELMKQIIQSTIFQFNTKVKILVVIFQNVIQFHL